MDGRQSGPLLPQQSEWFQTFHGDRDWYNDPSPFVLRIERPGLSAEDLAALVTLWLDGIDTTRMSYRRDGEGGWRRRTAIGHGVGCTVRREVDVTGDDSWAAAVTAGLTESLDIGTGRLAAAAVIPGSGCLYAALVVHHLASDATGWGLLMSDLKQMLENGPAGRPRRRPGHQVAADLESFANTAAVADEFGHWMSLNVAEGLALPVARPYDRDRLADVRRVALSFNRDITAQIFGIAMRRRLTIGELLCAVIGAATVDAFGLSAVSIDHLTRGRDLPAIPGLKDTIGWLATQAPFVFRRSECGDGGALDIVRAHNQVRLGRGHGFSLLRHLSADRGIRQELEALPRPQIQVNYLGSVWESALPTGVSVVDPVGTPGTDPNSAPLYPMKFFARIARSQLVIELEHSGVMFASGTVETLLRHVAEEVADTVTRRLVRGGV